MWDRSIIKQNARVALRGRYWIAFLASLLFTLLAKWPDLIDPDFWRTIQFWKWTDGTRRAVDYFSFVGTGFGWLGILYGIFIINVLRIGISRFFVRNHFEPVPVETTFSGFQWNYANGTGAMFVTRLFIYLWTLLLIIPGIVKEIQYSMVPYLLSDNPSLPGERARQISRQMTDGQKWEIFVFDLSFLGWFFLGALLYGVGILFVFPYYYAAKAELYLFLRDRAIRLGFVHPQELCLTPPASQDYGI